MKRFLEIVSEAVDSLPDEELALLFLALAVFLAAALTDACKAVFEFVGDVFVMFGVLLEVGRGGINRGGKNFHVWSLA